MSLSKFVPTSKKSNSYSSKMVTNLQGKIKYSLKISVREPPYAHFFIGELGHQTSLSLWKIPPTTLMQLFLRVNSDQFE